MILPTKYLDLETSVLRIAAFMLEETRREPVIRLPALAERVDSFAAGHARFNFFPALNLLYLSGQIEYDEDADVLIRTPIVGGAL